MRTYNKSSVMKRAWKIYRNLPNISWANALKHSWRIEKEKANDISPLVMNKIINSLKSFNRSRSLSEIKPILSGTQEHFKLLNSKTGRRIMKLPAENDSREILETGELFAFDIMHQRRKESKNFKESNKKIKTTFRNRIINLDTCVPVNIEEYVHNQGE